MRWVITKRATKRLWQMRIATQRGRVVRMMFLGWSTAKIAAALHCSAETVRDLLASAEFQSAFHQYEQEQLATMDRQIKYGLCVAVKVLLAQLKEVDWRARDSAIQTFLRLHGRLLDRLDVEHHGEIQQTRSSDIIDLDALPEAVQDEVRLLRRRLLELTRIKRRTPLTQPVEMPTNGHEEQGR